MSGKEPGGLFIKGTIQRVPLTGVRIDVRGHGAAARVTVAQRYRNTESKPVEAVYSFPLEEGSAVCEFIVETGGRRIVGKVEEKEKAFEKYDDAMAQGHGAFLLDQDRPNIFTANIGNLKPNQEAVVSITYATELETHGDGVRVMIPTTISPRYIPQAQLQKMDPVELDHIAPPTVIGKVSYGLELSVEYEAQQGVKAVNCPSHPVEVEIENGKAKARLMGSDIQLDRDVVINITLARPHEAGAIVARDGDGTRAVMLNFLPELKSARGASEFIFIVDRSGSMEGESIAQARNALLLALRSMDEGDRFNVVGFGSTCELLFNESVAYSQTTLDAATQKISTWGANLGGTELLQPLQLVLDGKRGELPLQLMLLTDGQVGNEADCIALAGKHLGRARIFSFGIGSGASEHLVRGLARASGGQAEFIHPNERIEPKVLRQFSRAASPYLKNVRIDWNGLKTDLIAPEEVPPLFNGDRLTVYARVIGGHASEIAITADGPAGAVRIPLKVDLERVSDAPAVPALMARKAIQELEEGRGETRGSSQEQRKQNAVKNRVLELALRYQLMSSQTSFVAIEERTDAEKSTERAELRRVPVALTHGWGGLQEQADGGARPMKSLTLGAPAPAMARARAAAVPGGMIGAAPKAAAREEGLMRKIAGFFGGGERADQETSLSDNIHMLRCESAEDPLQTLTQQQLADGRFEFSDLFCATLGIETSVWTAWLKELAKFKDARGLGSTLAALVILETKYAGRRDEWRMLAEKAERWLAKQKVSVPTGHATLQDWARAALKL